MSAVAILHRMLSAATRHGDPRGQLRRLFLEDTGQDVVEYALLTAFIGFAGAAAWEAAHDDSPQRAVDGCICHHGGSLLVRRAHAAHSQLADLPGGGARSGCGERATRWPGPGFERGRFARRPGNFLPAVPSEGT